MNALARPCIVTDDTNEDADCDQDTECAACGFKIHGSGMTFIPAVDLGEEAARDAHMVSTTVMAEITRLVEDSDAVLVTFESGRLELRLATGEAFHLAEETITRVA